MLDIKSTCCVTGHRDIPAGQVAYVKEALRREVELAVAEGYRRFISGFAEGVDQYFAEAVLEAAELDYSVILEAAIPYRKRQYGLLNREDTRRMLLSCVNSVISEAYAPNVFYLRNLYMVKESSRIIAVYDGRRKGGTYGTMRLAKAAGRAVRLIPIQPR